MKNKAQEEAWRDFLELCTHLKTREQFKEFFDLFLTLEEKEDLAMRYRLVQALLKEELSQREIADKLKVSISKITRGSNALKIVSDRLRKFLKQS